LAGFALFFTSFAGFAGDLAFVFATGAP